MRLGALVVALAVAGALGPAAGDAALAGAPAGASPDGPGPEAVAAARDAVLADTGYQRDLPGRTPSKAPTSRHLPESRSHRPTVDVSLPPLPGLGFGLWLLLALAALVALVLVAVALLRGGRPVAMTVRTGERPAAARPVAEPEPGPGGAGVPEDEPARLARAGRFAEAIHACLLLALAASARTVGPPAPGRTSRALWRRSTLGDDPRRALGALVDAVERTLFAGEVPDGVAYARCVAHLATVRAAGAKAAA